MRFGIPAQKPAPGEIRPLRRRDLRASHRRSGRDRGAGPVREDNFTAVRTPLWIDRAMSGVQSSTGTGIFRALTCPVRTAIFEARCLRVPQAVDPTEVRSTPVLSSFSFALLPYPRVH